MFVGLGTDNPEPTNGGYELEGELEGVCEYNIIVLTEY